VFDALDARLEAVFRVLPPSKQRFDHDSNAAGHLPEDAQVDTAQSDKTRCVPDGYQPMQQGRRLTLVFSRRAMEASATAGRRPAPSTPRSMSVPVFAGWTVQTTASVGRRVTEIAVSLVPVVLVFSMRAVEASRAVRGRITKTTETHNDVEL